MKRLELRTDNLGSLRSPVTVVLVILTALAVVSVVTPLIFRQMKLALTASANDRTPIAREPWPTPPATYAPAVLAPPATLRPTPAAPTPTPLPPPAWQALNYLTSVEFTTASVVDAQHTTNIQVGDVPLFNNVVTDRLLMKAVGKVQLGVNLGKVSDVKITGTKIAFVAPNPEVVSVELLPDQSQIYDSVQVWFLSQYQGLEKDALEKARQQLGDEVADNPSMMNLASQMARLQLTEFLRKAGFTSVEITFKDMR
ncbi:MAG: DUF4230 domain-containing protein [Caldilineaceae bacterium]